MVDYREFAAQMEALSKSYRVVACSRRYHWPNGTNPGGPDYSEQVHADDLVAFIRKLKLGRVHLVGHSYGGSVAALVARDHPKLVRSLVLGEPGLFSMLPQDGETSAFLAELGKLRPQMLAAFERGDNAGGLSPIIDFLLRPGKFADLPEDFRTKLLDNAPSWRLQITSKAPPLTFVCADAKQITARTLLLYGESTTPEFSRTVTELHKCLPHSEVARIPKSGHGLFFDNPEAVNQTLLDFLAKGAAPRSSR
jgi:pimeloyl-ACP methyl ester carboxylesterase